MPTTSTVSPSVDSKLPDFVRLDRLNATKPLLVGSEDPIVPVSVMEEVQTLVRDSELVVVQDAGHSAYFEKPREFNSIVLDFIARRAQY